MTIIVIDLEWNQHSNRERKIEDLDGEIIQIGAAKIDMDCNILDSFSVFVKPSFYTRIKKEIEKLTLITDEDLRNKGVSFKEAIESFKSWCGDDPVFISWGPEDFYMLANNLYVHEMDSSWLPKSYDAQLMFDDMEKGEGRQFPLNYALWYFNEKPDGLHNALADVLSTVKILSHLDISEGLNDEYFRCDDLD